MADQQQDGWNEYQRLVLHQLEAHTHRLDKIEHRLAQVHTDMVLLKFKVGAIGGGSGVAVSAITNWLMQ